MDMITQASLFLVLPTIVCVLTILPLAMVIWIMRKVQEKQLQRALKELEDTADDSDI